MSAPDPRTLRDAFGTFMTGVTVVTARAADRTPVGFTANSFSSVSLDPPLLLVCPGRFLSTYQTFSSCAHFAISVLAEGQEDIATVFAGSREDRFVHVAHSDDMHGVPVITGAVAQFSCSTHRVIEAGDHCILLGLVADVTQFQRPGLGYASGRFFSLGTERAALDHAPGLTVAGAIIEDGDSVWLEKTPKGFRPVQCARNDRGALLDHLRGKLTDMGITASLGQAYSVFDDTARATHFSYFLAHGTVRAPHPDVQAIPIPDLPALAYASPAIATMMQRFAREARSRSFGLYFGNTEQGAVHAPTDRM